MTKSRTPINAFALAMMACAAILGASATQVDNICDLTASTYTLHIFPAVSGTFFATILFCRKGTYHPEDLAKAKQAGVEDLGHDRPMIAASFIFLTVVGYTFYQAFTYSLDSGPSYAKAQMTQCVNEGVGIRNEPVTTYLYQYRIWSGPTQLIDAPF